MAPDEDVTTRRFASLNAVLEAFSYMSEKMMADSRRFLQVEVDLDNLDLILVTRRGGRGPVASAEKLHEV